MLQFKFVADGFFFLAQSRLETFKLMFLSKPLDEVKVSNTGPLVGRKNLE